MEQKYVDSCKKWFREERMIYKEETKSTVNREINEVVGGDYNMLTGK